VDAATSYRVGPLPTATGTSGRSALSPDDSVPFPGELVQRLTREAAPDDGDPATEHLRRLCRAASTALDVDGCAVHLLLEDGDSGIAALSPGTVAPLADLAFTVGEGPTLDAFTLRRPVLAGNLAQNGSRWPGFTQAAADLGVRAVLSFPLQVGGLTLGVLELYCFRPRTLDDRETALALAFADLATGVVLDGPLGPLAPVLDHRAEVHQAQGMVMVDLRVDMREALVRMRAHAFRTGTPLIELARSIINGSTLTDAGNE
jgi:hypothetical protein